MDRNIDLYWEKQIDIYDGIKGIKRIKYKKWQPARWSANKSAVKLISNHIKKVGTSLELGAGSLAFSFELYDFYKNHIIAIDRSKKALKFGECIAKDMNIPIQYINQDFFDVKEKNLADIVLSLGVIEHYNKIDQVKFLKLCKRLSKNYVFVAIPNQNSEIFKEYLKWANNNEQLYDEQHKKFDLDDLEMILKELDMEILLKDGFQIFLSESDFWDSEKIKNNSLIKKLKNDLKNKKITDNFENYHFSEKDIDKMSEIELELSKELRIQNCFMNFILARKKIYK